jgi:hypothetical protein
VFERGKEESCYGGECVLRKKRTIGRVKLETLPSLVLHIDFDNVGPSVRGVD